MKVPLQALSEHSEDSSVQFVSAMYGDRITGDPYLAHPDQAEGFDVFVAQRVNAYEGLGAWRQMSTPWRKPVYENDDDVWHVRPHNPAYEQYAEGGDIREAVQRYCLSGDTEVVTREGLMAIRDLAGTEPQLLVPTLQGLVYKNRGTFRSAPVRQFGEQLLFRVVLSRDGVEKELRATAQHRWLVTSRSSTGGEKQSWHTTAELTAGMKLKMLRRENPERTPLMAVAVAQGFTFGDGSLPSDPERAANLDIYDNGKDEALLTYFPGRIANRTHHGEHAFIEHLPRSWKSLPAISESRAFLLSWLAGYFAADGTVSPTGVCSISSARREHLEFVRSVAAVCGVGYRPIGSHVRTGIDGKDSELFRIVLRRRDLPAWFFAIEEHAKRAAASNARPEGPDSAWQVKSVEHTGCVEPVYCATVEGIGAFALADDLMTGNCDTASLITTTTPYLAELHRDMSPHVPVTVLPNYIPEWVLDLQHDDRQGHPRVGWAGGSSHGRDLMVPGNAVKRFMQRFRDWHMYVSGVDFRKVVGADPERSFHIRWIPVCAQPRLYYRSIDFDIGLAPLADNSFSRSKSPVKALEYMSRGIPVIASDVEPYRRFITHGVNGFLVRRDHEWLSYLSELASDEELRLRMSAAALETAREHVIEKHWQEWENAYRALWPIGWGFQG